MRMLTEYVSRMSGPTATITAAPIRHTATRQFLGNLRDAGAIAASSVTAKTRWSQPQYYGGQQHDGHAAEDRTNERADNHLSAPEGQACEREAEKRGAGDHHQHKGVDEPRHTHVGVDARKRSDESARERSEPTADHEGEKPHPSRVDTQSAGQVLVHNNRAG